MLRCLLRSGMAWLGLLTLLFPVQAGDNFRYPEGKHGKGELRYVNGVPVLMVQGTPDEIGEQVAVLGLTPAKQFLQYPKELVERFGAGAMWPVILSTGKNMVPQFPQTHRQELDAMIRCLPQHADMLVAGNTAFDIKKMVACCTVVVEPARSREGKVLFGRNLDYPSLGYLHHYTLVTVYRPTGKRAFVSIGFPGLVGVLSGMNDAGLTVAVSESFATRDHAPAFDRKGVPYALIFRRILEECGTIDEAEKLLRSVPRTTHNNLTICDAKTGVVLEISTKNVVRRPAKEGFCTCTNHFLSEELAPKPTPNTYRTLDRLAALEDYRTQDRLSATDVAHALHAACMGDLTLQSMVFAPETRTVHLSLGNTPATLGPYRTLELKEMMAGTWPAVGKRTVGKKD